MSRTLSVNIERKRQEPLTELMAGLLGVSFPAAHRHRFTACQASVLRFQKVLGFETTVLLCG